MVKEKIRVLIADDDIDFCFVCKAQINLFSDVICCGVAHDGRETIQKITDLQPDVVLLDDIMPRLDGLGVLEQLKCFPPEKIPHIIVNSASAPDKSVRELLRCGAAYFLEKPFEAETLLRRIRAVCTAGTENAKQPVQAQSNFFSIERTVLQAVMDLGVPTKLIGYDYIQEALCILILYNATRPTLKQIYEKIAERHGSDGRCVENAISSAIKAALVNRTSAMENVVDSLPDGHVQTISNGKFLTLVAQNIRLTSL